MIEVCPFVADVEGGGMAELYAVLNGDRLTFYQIEKDKAQEFKNKFQLKGFYIQEAKDMWTQRIQPHLNAAPPIT